MKDVSFQKQRNVETEENTAEGKLRKNERKRSAGKHGGKTKFESKIRVVTEANMEF